MKPFKLTRLEMAKLMYALKGQLDVSPLAILLRSADLAPDEPEDNLDIPEFIAPALLKRTSVWPFPGESV